MDPQLIQQLSQIFQQGLQVLQQAGASAGAPAADPAAGAPDMGGDDDMGGMPADASAGAPGMGDDDDMGGDDGMGGGASLHDRISQLESHTGLKKSASSAPIVDRLDMLEEHWLGEAYEGSALDRVTQLEGVVLKKSATRNTRKQSRTQQPATPAVDDAPDVIPLDTLIKTAISEGVQQVLGQMQQTSSNDLPSITNMRKDAATSRPAYNQRRSVASNQTQSDADLTKAAQSWGYDEEDLDKPVSLGDALMLQYHATKSGASFGSDD